jgi:hypothetical protein
MTLTELKLKADQSVQRALECGANPDEIGVTLQLDYPGSVPSVWGSESVELHYDNNGTASGCVLVASLDGGDTGSQRTMEKDPDGNDFFHDPISVEVEPDTPVGPEIASRTMLIEIEAPADFEHRLDNQQTVEEEIRADRWKWRWA